MAQSTNRCSWKGEAVKKRDSIGSFLQNFTKMYQCALGAPANINNFLKRRKEGVNGYKNTLTTAQE